MTTLQIYVYRFANGPKWSRNSDTFSKKKILSGLYLQLWTVITGTTLIISSKVK